MIKPSEPEDSDARMDDEQLRDWIDKHDPPTPNQPTTELDAQRTRHQPTNRAGATERSDDGTGALINNTGDDGDAPTG